MIRAVMQRTVEPYIVCVYDSTITKLFSYIYIGSIVAFCFTNCVRLRACEPFVVSCVLTISRCDAFRYDSCVLVAYIFFAVSLFRYFFLIVVAVAAVLIVLTLVFAGKRARARARLSNPTNK